MSIAPVNPPLLSLGAGTLFVAPIGTALPTDVSTALPAAWVAVGATKDGTSIDVKRSFTEINCAERQTAIASILKDENVTLQVDMYEISIAKLLQVMGGGTVTSTGTTPSKVFKYAPPKNGAQTPVRIVWQSNADDERWIFPKCVATSGFKIDRKASDSAASLAASFTALVPDDGSDAWTVLMAEPRSGGVV